MDEILRTFVGIAASLFISWTALRRVFALDGSASIVFGLTMMTLSLAPLRWMFDWMAAGTPAEWPFTLFVLAGAVLMRISGASADDHSHKVEVTHPRLRFCAVVLAIAGVAVTAPKLAEIKNPIEVAFPMALKVYSARIEDTPQGERPVLILDAEVVKECETDITLRIRQLSNIDKIITPNEPIYRFRREKGGYSPPSPRKEYRIPLPDPLELPVGPVFGEYVRNEKCLWPREQTRQEFIFNILPRAE